LKEEVAVFSKTTKNILTAFNSFNRYTDLKITTNDTSNERNDHRRETHNNLQIL